MHGVRSVSRIGVVVAPGYCGVSELAPVGGKGLRAMLSLAERDWRDGGLGVWAVVEVGTTVGTEAEGLVVGMIGSGSD